MANFGKCWRRNGLVPEHDLYALFVRPIHASGLRYLVAGSVASVYYSEPRLTIDVDIPLWLGREDAAKIRAIFLEPEYYLPPEDVIVSEVQRECRGHFNAIHLESGLKADFYPAGAKDNTFLWAWENKRTVQLGDGRAAHLAPPEYVVLWKLIYFEEGRSEKHLRDVRSLMRHHPEVRESEFLKQQRDEKRLEKAWATVGLG